MKHYTLLLLSVLTLTSCGSNSDGSNGPGVGQFEINKTPKVGQQVTKSYTDEENELELYLGDDYSNSVKCTYANYKTTKTLVKVDGDKIFVYSKGEYSKLIASENANCPSTYSYPGSLKLKSIKGEAAFLNREIKKFVTEECLSECVSSTSGNKISYSGVYGSSSDVNYRIQAVLTVNTNSPWLSPFLSHVGVYSTLDGSQSDTFSSETKIGFLADVDSLNVNFSDYTIEIYNSAALNITNEVMNTVGNTVFLNKISPTYKASFITKDQSLYFTEEGLYHYGNNVECYTVEFKKISSITKFDDYIYENRLDEDVLVINSDRTIMELNKELTSEEHHVACEAEVNERNTNSGNYTSKYGFKINNDGTLTLDLYSADDAGTIYVPAN
jgi:hypothetical protein